MGIGVFVRSGNLLMLVLIAFQKALPPVLDFDETLMVSFVYGG